MMSRIAHCPECGNRVKVRGDDMTELAICPKCSSRLVMVRDAEGLVGLAAEAPPMKVHAAAAIGGGLAAGVVLSAIAAGLLVRFPLPDDWPDILPWVATAFLAYVALGQFVTGPSLAAIVLWVTTAGGLLGVWLNLEPYAFLRGLLILLLPCLGLWGLSLFFLYSRDPRVNRALIVAGVYSAGLLFFLAAKAVPLL